MKHLKAGECNHESCHRTSESKPPKCEGYDLFWWFSGRRFGWRIFRRSDRRMRGRWRRKAWWRCMHEHHGAFVIEECPATPMVQKVCEASAAICGINTPRSNAVNVPSLDIDGSIHDNVAKARQTGGFGQWH